MFFRWGYLQVSLSVLIFRSPKMIMSGTWNRNFKRQIETRDQSGIIIVHITICLSGAAAAKSLQSCPTLCDPIDGSPPGSPVPGIPQARTLEWVAISFSNAWMWKVKVKSLSCVRLLGTPWTAAFQAPPSTGFSRQEYWSGVPLPSLHLKSNTLQINYTSIKKKRKKIPKYTLFTSVLDLER